MDRLVRAAISFSALLLGASVVVVVVGFGEVDELGEDDVDVGECDCVVVVVFSGKVKRAFPRDASPSSESVLVSSSPCFSSFSSPFSGVEADTLL